MSGRRLRKRRPAAKRLSAAVALGNLGEALALVGTILAVEAYRPRRREDCSEAARPCPFVGCKLNLLVDVTEDGEIILNSGQADADRGEGAGRILGPELPDREFHRLVNAHLEWWRMAADRARRLGTRRPESCVADVVDQHHARLMGLSDRKVEALGLANGLHLETVGDKLFVTRERARQIEAATLRQLRQSANRIRARILDAGPVAPKTLPAASPVLVVIRRKAQP